MVNFKIYGDTKWLKHKTQLQYTYCPISHQVKATRGKNLVSQQNIAREMRQED